MLPEPPSLSSDGIHPNAAAAPGYLASHATRIFDRLVDSRVRSHDLSLPLIDPMLLLLRKGPMLHRDLVPFSANKQPAMIALLDKPEALGMIDRATTESDKRAATVRLTDQVLAATAVSRKVLLAINAKALNGFAQEEA